MLADRRNTDAPNKWPRSFHIRGLLNLWMHWKTTRQSSRTSATTRLLAGCWRPVAPTQETLAVCCGVWCPSHFTTPFKSAVRGYVLSSSSLQLGQVIWGKYTTGSKRIPNALLRPETLALFFHHPSRARSLFFTGGYRHFLEINQQCGGLFLFFFFFLFPLVS